MYLPRQNRYRHMVLTFRYMGGRGGGRYADCPALPLWKTFIHSIIEQPYIALCSLAIRLGIKLSLAYPYGQPFYPQHIPKRMML